MDSSTCMLPEPMLGTERSAAGWEDGNNTQQDIVPKQCSRNENLLLPDMRTSPPKDVLSLDFGDRECWCTCTTQAMVVTPELPQHQQVGSSSNPHETRIQMNVTWKGSQDFRTNYHPDPDACALQAAQQELYWSGLQQHEQYHSLRLIANQTLGQRCNAATGWEQLIWGTAIFHVTLLSQPPIQPLDWKAFQQLEKMFGPNGRGAASKASSDVATVAVASKVEER